MGARVLITPSLKAVRESLARALPRLPRDPQANLFERGILDSLSLVGAIVAMEKAFGMTFAPEDLRGEHFATLQQIVRTVERVLARKADA